MPPALHERLRFDTADGQVSDQSRRYVLLRADVLMGLFDELPNEVARADALRAFGRSVATRGAASLRDYAAAPDVDAAALIGVVESAAASLGWGRWQLTREGSTALTLDVRNSPFAAAATKPSARPVCHAIAGMLEALAVLVLGPGARAHETACAASGLAPRCTFVARVTDPDHAAASSTDPLEMEPS